MINKTSHPDTKYRQARGFTLVELLVSIALVVILILGINMVFTSAGKTVGTGMAVSEATRAFRSAYTTLRNDIERDPANTVGMLPVTSNPLITNRTPAMVIIGRQIFNQPVDPAGNVANCNLDSLAFFAQGSFRRQTGSNPGEFFASMVPSTSAFVWYGHAWLPANGDPSVNANWYYDGVPSGTTMTFPGYGNATSNPNNYYAKDWRLARMVIGVQTPNVTNQLIDYVGAAQQYLARAQGPVDPTSLAPFSLNSGTTFGGAVYAPPANPRIQWSQCDLAGVDLNFYRDSVVAMHAGLDPNPANRSVTWGFDHFGNGYRFRTNPYPARPLTPVGAAQTLPIFLNGCMSFKVDFAGDLDNNGTIDLTLDGTGLQWYGTPNGLPLADPKCVTTVQGRLGGATPIYEHYYNAAGAAVPAGDPSIVAYGWAWSQYELASQPVGNGNRDGGRPSLIRLTVTLTDSNGRLPSGLTQEFIFEVPQN